MSRFGRGAFMLECDVLNLHGIYLRWLLVTGQMNSSGGYERSQAQLATFLSSNERSHHGEFLAK
jgi:Predicted 3'-5' exonuclease related to the exonuclease domain of PolB